jgi:hypothetical protein
MKPSYLLALVMLCLGCAVLSSPSHSSHVDGTWSGTKIYGGASCANGTFIGTGTGNIVGKLHLVVEGNDEIGSEVTATEESCVMQGKRTATGFTAEAISGCSPELIGITLTLTGDNAATISYRGDITKIPARASTPACLANVAATASR